MEATRQESAEPPVRWTPAALGSRAERTLLAALLIVPLLLAWWVHFGVGGLAATLLVDNAVEALAPLVAAFACARAASRSEGPLRTGWWLLAGASFSWALGQMAWGYYEAVARVDVPTPGLPDAGFLLSIPLTVAGMVLLARPVLRGAATRTFLDGAGLAASLLILSWGFIFRPLVAAGHQSWARFWLDASYPVGDIMVATVALIVWVRAPPNARRTFSLLSAGLLALAVADTMYWVLSLRGTYGTGNFANALWPAGFLAIALGAWEAPARYRLASKPSPVPTPTQVLFPFVLVLPTLAVVAASAFAQAKTIDRLLVGMTIAWFLVVMARQSLLLTENARLAQRLAGALASSERTAAAFDRSRRELAEAQEVAGLGSWTWDVRTRRMDWSDQQFRALGLPPHHVAPTLDWFLEVVDPRDRAAVRAAMEDAAHRMADFTLRYRVADPQGERWVETKGHAEPALADGRLRFIGTTRETGQDKASEEATRREAFYRALTENSTDAVGVYDREGRRMFAGGSAQDAFGYAPAELVGTSAFSIVHPDDVPRARSAFVESLAKPGQPVRVRLRARRKDGSYVEVETVAVNRLDDPAVRGIITNTRPLARQPVVVA